ncbi:MAG: FAD-dependent oxidoreductase, partial [bacterium]|nr:FAD-dependent oxidoreductase [bacterium]
MRHVNIVGGGLAGSEAAWQLAKRNIQVSLFEMRPALTTGAHHTGLLAELVCSNSLRAANIENAVGLLKEEMRRAGSLIIEAAMATQVPAGGALAVDRVEFAEYITNKLESMPNITIVRQEIVELPKGVTIVASGPLTSNRFSAYLQAYLGEEHFSFFDAAAPIV